MPAKSQKKNTSWFVEKSKGKFGDEFDYTKSFYLDYSKTRIALRCVEHDQLFETTATLHLNTKFGGCEKCAKNHARNSDRHEKLNGQKAGLLIVLDQTRMELTSSGHPRRQWKTKCTKCELEEWRDANNLKAIQSKWTKNDNGGCRRCTYQVRGRNLAGKIMGSWTVTGNRRKDPIVLVNGVETTQIQWLCRCLNCGITEKWLSTGYLKSVEGGCGCKKRTLDGKSKTREGRIFTGAKRRAMLEGIPFDICLEDIDIPTHCPVLGIEISTENSELLDNSPSLDKFYPAAGYVRGNVQVISWKANRLKSNGTPEEWLRVAEWCQREDVKKRLAGE